MPEPPEPKDRPYPGTKPGLSDHLSPRERSAAQRPGEGAEEYGPQFALTCPLRGHPLPGGEDMAAASPLYAELRCKTNFSFLEGASHPDELVGRAAQLGYAALAVTDRNSLAGVVRAHAAARSAGLKIVIGAEITPHDAPAVLLYAPDAPAYYRLSRLITRGRRAAPKGECHLGLRDVAEHAEGLLAAVVPPDDGSDPTGLAAYREIFGDRCHLAASLHLGPNDEQQLGRFVELARQSRLPLVATNDVHYHEPARRPLQDVLAAIRLGRTVAQLGSERFPNGERYLKSPRQMERLFRPCPEAIARGLELARQCTFALDELRYEYPEELCPPGTNPTEYLAKLTWDGAHGRYPEGIPDKVRALLEHELGLVAELGYEPYFLTVWDLVRFARSREILCQGRGSAANSAVCFCLGITSVDPDRIEVLFERFVSKERDEAPDIDVDFEHERREEVFQYIYEKYGRDHAGIVAEVITYRTRSALRDVGKALGLSLDRVDALAKAFGRGRGGADPQGRVREAGLDPRSRLVAETIRLATELKGFPRHLSQHVGGFVISRRPLCELVPIENAAMPDRTFIEWDKNDLDALGILKVDCLSLGMLTAIHRSFDLIAAHHDEQLTLATVPAEDKRVYEMLCRADAVGVFQVESRAQMSMLPRLRPREFYDLVIEVAIVRPGPIQGGMVHPFLRRRDGLEPVTYPSDALKTVLAKTLGVPLFQEQAMRVAIVGAGFTPGEADQLRRAMGTWRSSGAIEQFRAKLCDGMVTRGLSEEFAHRLYEQICGFGEYGFPESHAASFALLAYVSAWLKCYYPCAFTAALLNSQPMGFYAPAQLIRDAREHGVTVCPIDINRSDWDCTLEPLDSGEKALRLGLRLIGGLARKAADAIVAARAGGPYRSVADLARRADLGVSVLARLASADSFAGLGIPRRLALWELLATDDEPPLFAGTPGVAEETPALSPMSLAHQVDCDYQSLGLSLKAHPLRFVRPELTRLKVVPASALANLPDKATVHVAGLVLVRQQPSTAKGIVFFTLEDETGIVNLIVRPKIWQRYRRAANRAATLMASGRLQRAHGVTHVVATRLNDLTNIVPSIAPASRDFH
ncbi:MAG: error-prone DNA polymerase [Isosphaeraceae bacterium]|nr:error-prone DNA polymerase [Isosphaeraceae bacterium]